ncbi:integrase catalytic domain-containing protein [Trichonephila clavipes]|nr:integrase catalytic domain-containing protein [Trichonephila clavipes]
MIFAHFEKSSNLYNKNSPKLQVYEKYAAENKQAKFTARKTFHVERDRYTFRFKILELLRQHFWDRWHKEVLHHYQSRPKWKASQSEVQVGNLVLISDDNRPPLSWPMARILKLIPGMDGSHRVAILQTGSGLTSRWINKIVVLPICSWEDGDSEIHHLRAGEIETETFGSLLHGRTHNSPFFLMS